MARQEYDETVVRWLTPDVTHVFEGTYSLLHCTVKGDTLYRGVFAVRMFPVSYPDQFISLRHHDIEEKVREIGIIPDLNAFAAEAQKLVRSSLDRHYYEQVISRINEVRNEYGLLFFDVETQRGREKFVMPWRYDRAEDYSANGKLLLDVSDNRYIVPDVAELPPADRRRLTKYIYW
jgi:hypothetical protein